jgi:hypothetical protein
MMSDSGSVRSSSDLFIDLFSGIGLGLLVGVIVGLSLTPVVSVIIGALGSVLAVFLGLQGGQNAGASALGSIRLNGVRIGSFGFATVAGLLFALFVRSTEPFASPIEDHVKRWTDAGFPAKEARQMVVYERTGIAPAGAIVNSEIAAQQQAQKSHALFADLGEINLCYELNPERAQGNAGQVLTTYRLQDNETLNDVAQRVEAIPEQYQIQVLDVIWHFVCSIEKSGEEE